MLMGKINRLQLQGGEESQIVHSPCICVFWHFYISLYSMQITMSRDPLAPGQRGSQVVNVFVYLYIFVFLHFLINSIHVVQRAEGPREDPKLRS